jgi:hypothetical protein
LFLWGELEEWIVLIAMSIPPIWPLFRPYMQRFIKTTTSQSRSRQYKQTYPQSSATGCPSGLASPRVTTTVTISSNKDAPTSPSKMRMSKYGEVIEEPLGSPLGTETAVEEEVSESRRSLPVVDNIRNSKKLQEGWMELSDLKEQGHQQ